MTQHFGAQQAIVEDHYRRYLISPQSVGADWCKFFEDMEPSVRQTLGQTHSASEERVDEIERAKLSDLPFRVSRMAAAYRSRGHYYAKVDPLGIKWEDPSEDLGSEQFGISDAELDSPVHTDIKGYINTTPREMIDHLRTTYCGSVGFEVMHVEDDDERQWLLDRIEEMQNAGPASSTTRKWALGRLSDAQELERFLHTQYVGAKRFSLEGLESMIPMLHKAVDHAGDAGVTDVVIGMAHRGRLNVLVNVLGKSHKDLFVAFNDSDSETFIGSGDVKYHLGHRATHITEQGNAVELALCFNPSHLEFVNPVVAGRVRARMDEKGDVVGRSVLPVCIHGDAAFIGQGVVPETLNLAELEGYRTGGTLHIVANNQVGFTTSPSDSRSSRYASDIVRFMRVPVFHVNAEDVEAVLRVTQLAMEYRQKFLRDVCIDLIGYRRFGHNEADEPRFTQPLMYKVIDERQSLPDAFASQLVGEGVITEAEKAQMIETRRAMMMEQLKESREEKEHKRPSIEDSRWDEFFGGQEQLSTLVPTAVESQKLLSVLNEVANIPASRNPHRKIKRVYDNRLKAVESNKVDWGTAEMLAYATLANEGYRVRLTGQDARRGTFSHRHAYLADMETGDRWTPLNNVATGRGGVEIYDSPLSECAVLGFEYGYSLECPQSLVAWEAQFGDFANGAQVIIDQFISSGEDKWGRLTGLVMLLPHGFEGQGPEHSYARLGRFLQLCAEDNMQVVDVTTPAQIFHLLRRQVLRPWRKPLVIMSPKSLLRHKRCVSTFEDLSQGEFKRIIPDVSGTPVKGVRRVLLCSGRIYYDLEQEREARGANDVHIIRLEQLYPLHGNEIAEVLAPYGAGTELMWVQDEPWNLGSWYFIKARLQAVFGDDLRLQCVARAESASPATGSGASHKLEHKHLMNAAFGAFNKV